VNRAIGRTRDGRFVQFEFRRVGALIARAIVRAKAKAADAAAGD
jgi:hypothetical protein